MEYLSSNVGQVLNLVRFCPWPKDEMWLPLCKIKDCLSKYAVGPRKPAACVFTDVVHVDAFVDETEEAGIPNEIDGFCDLLIRVGRASADKNGHGPRILDTNCDADVSIS